MSASNCIVFINKKFKAFNITVNICYIVYLLSILCLYI